MDLVALPPPQARASLVSLGGEGQPPGHVRGPTGVHEARPHGAPMELEGVFLLDRWAKGGVVPGLRVWSVP